MNTLRVVPLQLRSATNLPAQAWIGESAPFVGAGGLLATNLPIGPDAWKFFRLRVGN